MKKNKKGKSPYKKYGKTPYKYSEHYDRWNTALRSGVSPDIVAELSRKHFEYCRNLFS